MKSMWWELEAREDDGWWSYSCHPGAAQAYLANFKRIAFSELPTPIQYGFRFHAHDPEEYESREAFFALRVPGLFRVVPLPTGNGVVLAYAMVRRRRGDILLMSPVRIVDISFDLEL
jgi:hypothetical protein